jgi:hypothetical protein
MLYKYNLIDAFINVCFLCYFCCCCKYTFESLGERNIYMTIFKNGNWVCPDGLGFLLLSNGSVPCEGQRWVSHLVLPSS